MKTNGKKMTQSERLYKLLTSKNNVTQAEMCRTLKVDYAGPYLSELKRVYGATVNYDWRKKQYHLERDKLKRNIGTAQRGRPPAVAAKRGPGRPRLNA